MTVTYHAGRRIQGTQADFDGIPAISGGWKELGRTTLQSAPSGSATFTDTFQNNTGWTFVGSGISVSGGEVYANTVTANGDNRIHKSLGVTLGDKFTAQWKHIPKGVSSNSVFFPIMNFTAGTGNLSTSTNQDRIYLFTDGSSQNLYARGQDGTTAGTNSNNQALTSEQAYYLTLVKDGTSLKVYVRSGSHTGTLVNTLSTTVSSGITGLTHVQTGAMTGGNAGTGSYKIESLNVWNNQTIVSSADDITVSSLDDKRYYMVLTDLQASGYILNNTRLNSDTGSNYAWRRSLNGASDSTSASQTFISQSDTGAQEADFSVEYITNLSSKEKLTIAHVNENPSTGAGTAPTRIETVGKWANTSDAVSTITKHNSHTGDYTTGSECVVLGYDPDDTHTTNFWEELASVDVTTGTSISTGNFTAKKYLWVQFYLDASAISFDWQFNSSTDTQTSTYSGRHQNNGIGAQVDKIQIIPK